MNKIFIGLISTVILLVLALVFLNKQIKPAVQDPVVTNKQAAQQSRLPELSEITGKPAENSQSGLMPLPSEPAAGGDKEDDTTVVSIDGESSEKLPPLEDYVLVPINKQGKDGKAAPSKPGAPKAQKDAAKPAQAAAEPAAQDKDPVASADNWQHPEAQGTDSLLRSATIGAVPAPAMKSERQPEGKAVDKNAGTAPAAPSAASAPAAPSAPSAPSASALPAAPAAPAAQEGPKAEAPMAAAPAAGQADTKQKQDAAAKAPAEENATEKTVAITPPQKNKKAEAKAEQAEKAAPQASAEKAAKTDDKKKADADKKNDRKAAGGQPKITILNRNGGATVRITMGRQIAYKQLLLSNPDRLVIDITGEYKDLRAPGVPSNSFVSNIRLGHYDNRTRIVFDLKEAPAKHRFILSKDKNRLDVRLDK